MERLNNIQQQFSDTVSENDFDIYLDTDNNNNIIFNPKQKHLHTLIWLHGLGDTAMGWAPIFQSDLNFVTKNTKIILLNAPIRKVTINQNQPTSAWFDIYNLPQNDEQDHKYINMEQLNQTSEYLNTIIKQQIDTLESSKNVFLGGFSQGGQCSLYTGLSCKYQLGGIFCVSGLLIQQKFTNKNIPIRILHGKKDLVLDFNIVQQRYQKLLLEDDILKQQTKILYEDNTGHEVTQQGLLQLKQWFHELI